MMGAAMTVVLTVMALFPAGVAVMAAPVRIHCRAVQAMATMAAQVPNWLGAVLVAALTAVPVRTQKRVAHATAVMATQVPNRLGAVLVAALTAVPVRNPGRGAAMVAAMVQARGQRGHVRQHTSGCGSHSHVAGSMAHRHAAAMEAWRGSRDVLGGER